jgi:hypothetical protein
MKKLLTILFSNLIFMTVFISLAGNVNAQAMKGNPNNIAENINASSLSLSDQYLYKKTCSDIFDQIDSAKALETYAKERYEAHLEDSDSESCQYAADFFYHACSAKQNIERLRIHLSCESDEPIGSIIGNPSDCSAEKCGEE